MPKTKKQDKSNSSESLSLDKVFQSAVEKANSADIDEPLLVWPELPEDLKNEPPEKKAERNQEG